MILTSDAPYVVDLDSLTQEQFDRAMQHTGSCRYSAPCIIGAMLPQDVIDRLVRLDKDEDCIERISRHVIFKDAEQAQRAERIQSAFDLFGIAEDAPHTLREALPHLDHSGY